MEMEKAEILRVLGVAAKVLELFDRERYVPEHLVHALMLIAARTGRELGLTEDSLVAQFQQWQRAARMDTPLTCELVLPEHRLEVGRIPPGATSRPDPAEGWDI